MFDSIPLPPAFTSRLITIPPGDTLAYHAPDWHDTLVIVQHGTIDLLPPHGEPYRFSRGAILCLAGIHLRALHNRGPTPATLMAISRKEPSAT